jgi:hypothetical protein
VNHTVDCRIILYFADSAIIGGTTLARRRAIKFATILSFVFLDTKKAELTQQDFELAIQNLVPSVSDEELRHYEKIQWEFNKNKMAEKEVEIGELELDGKPQPETVL